MSRRGATSIRGVLPVDKPAGMTSHDVVARIRRATGEGRVGHAGTLDPAATGLLVVLLGPYTRLEPYLSSAVKAYEARISFGSETDTDDAEGEVNRTAPVPASCRDRASAEAILSTFIGRSRQTPPAYSAIKVGGKVAHRAARAGEPLDVEPREVEIIEARLSAIDPADPAWHVEFTVSKGTYIRALARDIGRACGTAAHLSGLRRTRSGRIDLSSAHTLDETLQIAGNGDLDRLLIDPFRALDRPVIEVAPGATLNGRYLELPVGLDLDPGDVVAVSESGRLAALYRADAGALVPAVVLPEVSAA